MEEDSTIEHLPLGDYLAILGGKKILQTNNKITNPVMLETMLTNRGIHENVQVLNEYGIPIKLVKLLSQAESPNQMLLNSNYLPHLASILCCVMVRYPLLNDIDINILSVN